MLAFELSKFGIDNLHTIELDEPALKSGPAAGQALVKFKAASINYRDFMIAEGLFAPQDDLPVIPLSDGAGEVIAIGNGVTRVAVGDLVTPLFFPKWISGDAQGGERKVSTGLEAPGCLRQYGSFDEQELVKAADHLNAEQAACFPCAGLTAWNALVTRSAVKAGDTVLLLGTGGVSIFALQFAKALGATVIITSSSDDKLARAKALGADHIINYTTTPEWGEAAKALTNGRGVDAVVEIGGTGTLAQSFKAIRCGGHIAIIGALAGAQMEILVYELIKTNANLHGISVGNRDDFEAMMAFVDAHKITPVIEKNYPFEAAAAALRDIDMGKHFGKLTISI